MESSPVAAVSNGGEVNYLFKFCLWRSDSNCCVSGQIIQGPGLGGRSRITCGGAGSAGPDHSKIR